MSSLTPSRHPASRVRWSLRAAQITVVGSSALSAAGLLTYVVGSIARGYDVVAALVVGIPTSLVFLYAARRVHAHDLDRAAIVSIVGGLLTLAEIILTGLTAAYADPCFEVAHCTRGPTFGYVALTGATLIFVLTGALGLIVNPVAIGFAGWRRGHDA